MVSFLWARVWQWHNPDSSRASNIIIHFMQRQLRRLSVISLSACSLSGEYLWFKQNSHFKSGFCSLSFSALSPSPLRCHCYLTAVRSNYPNCSLPMDTIECEGSAWMMALLLVQAVQEVSTNCSCSCSCAGVYFILISSSFTLHMWQVESLSHNFMLKFWSNITLKMFIASTNSMLI